MELYDPTATGTMNIGHIKSQPCDFFSVHLPVS